jgi:hypothetical protein
VSWRDDTTQTVQDDLDLYETAAAMRSCSRTPWSAAGCGAPSRSESSRPRRASAGYGPVPGL